MIRDGVVILVSEDLARGLAGDFDGRADGPMGFCVELYDHKDEWEGNAWGRCNHRSIPGAFSSLFPRPRKRGSTWVFENDSQTIQITQTGGRIEVVVQGEDATGADPIVVVPSESPHEREGRWHRDAIQAFLEQASAVDPRLVERRPSQWEYEGKAIDCGLVTWECDQSQLVGLCGLGAKGSGDHLLVRARAGTFDLLVTSEQLERNKCTGALSGVGLPGDH